VQDGVPRANVDVVKFSAPNVKVGRPARVRIRKRGTRAVVTWAPASGAAYYQAVVRTGDGSVRMLTPRGKSRTVSMPGLAEGESARAIVIGISAGGRRGPQARATLRVARKRAASRRR
jgi:hypothetical protein